MALCKDQLSALHTHFHACKKVVKKGQSVEKVEPSAQCMAPCENQSSTLHTYKQACNFKHVKKRSFHSVKHHYAIIGFVYSGVVKFDLCHLTTTQLCFFMWLFFTSTSITPTLYTLLHALDLLSHPFLDERQLSSTLQILEHQYLDDQTKNSKVKISKKKCCLLHV